MPPSLRLLALLLCAAVLLRGSLLEHSELIDPTETRYASVAQEMILTDNWLTPQLPMPEGVVPYMGKPPLHFWLTASAYKIFRVEEWTARLPSWLGSVVILAVIWCFARRYFDSAMGLSAGLVAFSSVMFFFLAGASVTDVTLTALVSLATYSLYVFASSDNPTKKWAWASAACIALAFLTKGPVAIVLSWLPVLLWSLLFKKFAWLKKVPWFTASILFVAITLPWFLENEKAQPGSLWYFFWNENIGRYLFKEYGDKYGIGHVRPYGTSWLMLLVAFLPWSIILIRHWYKVGTAELKKTVYSNPHLCFCLVWGLSAALFFTFVRQLHAMYLLPAVPGLALSTAVLLRHFESDAATHAGVTQRSKVPLVLACFLFGAHYLGFYLDGSIWLLIYGLLVSVFGCLLLSRIMHANSEHKLIAALSLGAFLLYFAAIMGVTPFTDQLRSTSRLLELIAEDSKEDPRVPLVGMMSKNGFSMYWGSRAWKNELSSEIKVDYVEPNEIPAEMTYLILRKEHIKFLMEKEKADFKLEIKRGSWYLFKRHVSPAPGEPPKTS
jgi:4-amino-4-deoxy-L-arabinose transferase-like glycosyltransferase